MFAATTKWALCNECGDCSFGENACQLEYSFKMKLKELNR